MLLPKNENSLEKTMVSLIDFFSSESKSSKKDEGMQDKGSDTKLSYQMLL